MKHVQLRATLGATWQENLKIRILTMKAPMRRLGGLSALSNLYGLTPKVEAAIIGAIAEGHRERLISLIAPLHPADQADMVERLNQAQRHRFTLMMRQHLNAQMLTYLPEDILEEVVSVYGVDGLAQALPELDSDDAVDILED